jgi:hypothetical protein
MSYEVYTWRKPGETAWDCGCASLLLEDTRKAWSMITLVGKGEHEGTSRTLTKEQLYAHQFSGEQELAALLDRIFERAHADRYAAEHELREREANIV